MNFKVFCLLGFCVKDSTLRKLGSFPPFGEWEELVSITEPANNKELLEVFD
jgi:hypothetical protein